MQDKKDTKTGDLLCSAAAPAVPERGVVGRPRQYADAAERQRAYRNRLKAEGKRVVSRVVRDVRDTSAPLVSDVLDLSQVKGGRGV